MVGPALDDGRYFGALIAVGATQRPPRLVIDLQQWFTGEDAIAAAVKDGAIEPGEIIPNDYYIRNENPRWRTIEIDPAATVSLTVYPYGQIDDPQIVTSSGSLTCHSDGPSTGSRWSTGRSWRSSNSTSRSDRNPEPRAVRRTDVPSSRLGLSFRSDRPLRFFTRGHRSSESHATTGSFDRWPQPEGDHAEWWR